MGKISFETYKDDQLIKVETFTGPGNWKEMKKEHLILWAATMASSLTTLKAKQLLAAMLYAIPRKVFSKVFGEKERVKLSFAIRFLFKKNQLIAWLIPSFWFGLRKYHGPKDRLSNLTAEEFGLCELCYENFDKTKDKGYLDALAAILYRPRRYFGIDDDIRKPLTHYSREKRAKRFKKLPDHIRWSVYLNYEGCRNLIIALHKEVFKKAAPGATVKPASWAKVVQGAAGGIFGTLRETERSNVYKFLSELNDRLKEIADNKS